MTARFTTELNVTEINEGVWRLDNPLCYESDIVGSVVAPKGFFTDFASVPRIPVAFMLFGGRANNESVIHDYLYRIDSEPVVSFNDANKVFLEAMICQNKSLFVKKMMYWGVCMGGKSHYHKKLVHELISESSFCTGE